MRIAFFIFIPPLAALAGGYSSSLFAIVLHSTISPVPCGLPSLSTNANIHCAEAPKELSRATDASEELSFLEHREVLCPEQERVSLNDPLRPFAKRPEKRHFN